MDFGGWRNQMGECEMSRNGFNDCEREYNRREEAVEMAREERSRSMSDTPRTDEVWGNMHGSGYQMMLLAQKLERELEETVIQVKLAQKGYDYEGACEDARHYKELAAALRGELAEAKELLEHSERNAKFQHELKQQAEAELAAYKLWAEVEIADLREDLLDHIRMEKDAQEELAKAAARKFRGDPNNNWLMKPSLDWLENAYHGENQARCRMIAGMLRDLWRGDDTLGAMPVAIDAAIKGSAT